MITYDPEYEKELTLRAQQQDKLARRELIRLNDGLITKIIDNNHRNSNVPQEAIRAQAIKHLNEAIDKYDPGYNTKTSTYFHQYVEMKLQRYVDDRQFSVRIPEQHKVNAKKLQGVIRDISQGGKTPSYEEMAKHFNAKYSEGGKKYSTQDMKKFYNYIRYEVPGSTAHGDDGEDSLSLGEIVTATHTNAYGSLEQDLYAQKVINIVNTFPEPDRTILLHSYGIGGHEKLSPRNLALKLNMSRYMVEKKLKEATEKFAQEFNNQV